MKLWRIALVLGAVGLVCLIVWWQPLLHWAAIHTGTLNESGPYYGFWSGFGSDIGEVTLLAAVLAALRHHNCHVKGCLRLGRPVDGTPFVACHVHHPERDDGPRNVDAQTIVDAHADRVQ